MCYLIILKVLWKLIDWYKFVNCILKWYCCKYRKVFYSKCYVKIFICVNMCDIY